MTRRMIHMPADTDLNHLFVVFTQAERLLFEYGLKDKGWKVVFDNTKRRGGQCRYGAKELGISAHLFAIWTYEQCINLVLHEIAHILCPGEMHSKVWREKATEIGCTGTRCWGSNGEARIARSPAKYIGTCPNGHTVTRRRKSKVMQQRRSCGQCAPGFDPTYLITWKENT
jgi:predicted SprT family Zn-dependent metalloprotease